MESKVIKDEPMDIVKQEKTYRPGYDPIEEEHDEMVEEIDVVLNSSLAKELCLFQFPLRPASRPFSEPQQPAKFQNLRMKPIHFKLSAELEVDKYSHQYDENYERNMEMNVRNPFRINMNAVKVPLQTNYAVGVYKDGALHLTSIENMVQFRPTFSHIDSYHKKKLALKKEEDEKDDEPEEVTGETGMIPLSVQYKKKETARAAANRKKAQLKREEEEEPWSDLDFVPSFGLESEKVREKLYQNKGKKTVADVSKKQYLDLLNPVPPPSFSSNNSIVSLFTIQKKPIKDQILELLRNANIMTFGTVLKLAVDYESQDQVISLLEKDAVLIRGLWIIKSASCKDLKSARIKAARDFLLSMFHDKEHVDRKEFTEAVGLHVDDAKTMLDKIAILEYGSGWKLKLPSDQDFIRRFPEVVNRQESQWRERKEPIKKELERVLNEPAGASRKKNTRVGGLTNTEFQQPSKPLADSAEGQLTALFHETFVKFGVCNTTLLKSILHRKQQEKGPSNLLGKINEDSFKKALESVALSVQNTFVLKKLNNVVFDRYRDIILKNMYSKGLSFTKDEIVQMCRKELKEERDIPQSIFNKILNEVAYEAGGKWIFKDGSGSWPEKKP